MTVYARSDVSCVSISPAHGGCGNAHTRPAPGGKPVDLWQLTCSRGCEDVLRADPLWSSTISEVPETYDEQIVREDAEKRGKLDAEKRALSVQADTAEALKVLAAQAQESSGVAEAIKMLAAALAVGQTPVAPAAAAPAGVVQITPTGLQPVDLETLTFAELRKTARDLGVRISRSRSDQIEAIRERVGG